MPAIERRRADCWDSPLCDDRGASELAIRQLGTRSIAARRADSGFSVAAIERRRAECWDSPLYVDRGASELGGSATAIASSVRKVTCGEILRGERRMMLRGAEEESPGPVSRSK